MVATVSDDRMTLAPGARSGAVQAPASKSHSHRLLICASLGERRGTLRCGAISQDVRATIDCLRALGARIEEREADALCIEPIRSVPEGVCELPCAESGSTLRFLLPVAGALGARAVFYREGRLPERPISPLADVLRGHGMKIWDSGAELHCEGQLRAGEFSVTGNVSSQYISGLLLALALLRGGSTLRVEGSLNASGYVAMTEDALRLSGVQFEKDGAYYRLNGRQRFAPPAEARAEGDWSNATPFLCMGALSPLGVTVSGLSGASAQGDRAVLDILRRFGAAVETDGESVTVRRATLRCCEIDAATTPDLIPALAALAACAEGETRIRNAARLRLKESDRLQTTAGMLAALGADVTELPDGLAIRGKPALRGGAADAANDHRIAMAAAVAACASAGAVTVRGAACVRKSYPAFWEDFACLSM